jgi:hypothetical protein
MFLHKDIENDNRNAGDKKAGENHTVIKIIFRFKIVLEQYQGPVPDFRVQHQKGKGKIIPEPEAVAYHYGGGHGGKLGQHNAPIGLKRGSAVDVGRLFDGRGKGRNIPYIKENPFADGTGIIHDYQAEFVHHPQHACQLYQGHHLYLEGNKDTHQEEIVKIPVKTGFPHHPGNGIGGHGEEDESPEESNKGYPDGIIEITEKTLPVDD